MNLTLCCLDWDDVASCPMIDRIFFFFHMLESNHLCLIYLYSSFLTCLSGEWIKKPTALCSAWGNMFIVDRGRRTQSMSTLDPCSQDTVMLGLFSACGEELPSLLGTEPTGSQSHLHTYVTVIERRYNMSLGGDKMTIFTAVFEASNLATASLFRAFFYVLPWVKLCEFPLGSERVWWESKVALMNLTGAIDEWKYRRWEWK